jgi:hypothetical protein
MDLKKVEGSDFEDHEHWEIDGELSQMNVRDGSLKADIEGKVKGQNKENGIRTQK